MLPKRCSFGSHDTRGRYLFIVPTESLSNNSSGLFRCINNALTYIIIPIICTNKFNICNLVHVDYYQQIII